jgi:hypothetical protein
MTDPVGQAHVDSYGLAGVHPDELPLGFSGPQPLSPTPRTTPMVDVSAAYRTLYDRVATRLIASRQWATAVQGGQVPTFDQLTQQVLRISLIIHGIARLNVLADALDDQTDT